MENMSFSIFPNDNFLEICDYISNSIANSHKNMGFKKVIT